MDELGCLIILFLIGILFWAIFMMGYDTGVNAGKKIQQQEMELMLVEEGLAEYILDENHERIWRLKNEIH